MRTAPGWLAALLVGMLPLPGSELPPAAPPAGAIGVVRDACANFWALGPADREGRRNVLVLPAQSPTAWSTPTIPGLEAGRWSTITPQLDRGIVVADGRRALRFDPRTPEKGAEAFPRGGPEAAKLATRWRMAARLPSSNHDLTAAVVGGRVYVAGGVTSDFGYPAATRAFDELFELNPDGWSWRVVARFPRPRIYCATAAFDGRVWILGGDVLHEDGKRRPSTLAETYDPQTGALRRAPDLPVAWQAPLALAAGGRLWIMGSRDRQERGQMASIGPGETTWRVEPEALPHMWALAGAALDDKLYVCVPNTGLAVFDPADRRWTVIPGPVQPRSSQVAAWRGEIWIVGGCDRADWSEAHIYDPVQRTWRQGPSLPEPLAWGAAAVVNDHLVIVGGASPYGTANARTYAFSDRTYILGAEAIPPRSTPAAAAPLPRWSDARLRDTGEAGLPFASERVFPQFKFGRIGTILPVPASRPGTEERLLLIEIEGPVWTFPNRPDAPAPERMLDLPARFGQRTHTYALAFHPRYPEVPHVYVLYNRVQPKPSENVVARFTVATGGVPTIDPGSEQVLLRWPSDGHNGGDVLFGPDGFLYVSVGDRSKPGDPENYGQRVDVISGGVLRLDVERTAPGEAYSIPQDNPFVDMPGVRPEFWAYGLRNPWRMAFGPAGELWAGDNGDDSWESIHLVRKGHNYGWSVFEGTHPFKRNRSLAGPTPRLTPPVIEFSHAEARSIIGGFVYRGPQHPTLAGHYLFGDFVTGAVWAFQWDGAAPQKFRRIADTRGQMIAFGTDRNGEILMTRNDGEIHRLKAAPPPTAAKTKFPERLSEIGLFGAMNRHEPAPGVVPYEINAAMWSDGARARRLLAVAGWQAINVEAGGEGRWNLPDGSVVARTLELPASGGPRRVETQVMYRGHGVWRFYTYAWNEAQTDAELVPEAGEERAIPGLAPRTWRFAGRGECAVCHTTQTNFTIGLSLAQLNRDGDFSGLGRRVENQIAVLADAGMLRTLKTAEPGGLPRKIAPDDVLQPLESRARSYLDINCAHCHRLGGVGGRAAFQLAESVGLDRAGLVNGQPLVPLLGPGARIIAPGDPARSEIFHRMSLKEGGRMPLLGSQQTDREGVELVRRWIEGMAPR